MHIYCMEITKKSAANKKNMGPFWSDLVIRPVPINLRTGYQG